MVLPIRTPFSSAHVYNLALAVSPAVQLPSKPSKGPVPNLKGNAGRWRLTLIRLLCKNWFRSANPLARKEDL